MLPANEKLQACDITPAQVCSRFSHVLHPSRPRLHLLSVPDSQRTGLARGHRTTCQAPSLSLSTVTYTHATAATGPPIT